MKRYDEVLREVKRKSIHVIPGFAAIPIVVWLGKVVAIPIALLFLTLYLLNELHLKGLIRRPIPIATHTFRIMARREEIERRTFIGTIFFWSLTVIIIALLPPVKAAAAIMVSSFGDAAAAIVGKAFPKPSLPFNKRKSVWGSIAMFCISTICCIVAGVELGASLIASGISAFVEALTHISYLDELTVPIAASLVLAIL